MHWYADVLHLCNAIQPAQLVSTMTKVIDRLHHPKELHIQDLSLVQLPSLVSKAHV